MLVSARRLFTLGLIVSALGLSACGFQPMYDGTSFAQLPGLEIDRGEDRIDYLIEDSLRDFLGSGQSPYRLELENRITQRGLSLSGSGIARQTAILVVSTYKLYDGNGTLISQGRVQDQSFFDSGSDPYTLVSGQSAAETQAAEAVAERLVQELTIALRNHSASQNP